MVHTEKERMTDPRPWRRFGPYLADRQWGTVREDYSADGEAWEYFPHDHARSRAYRWGEDGIAGLSDDRQLMCLAVALWNGRDPILKERLFGLTNREGNRGEDVKELYYYLDATPSHSYAKALYKYPQAAFPYEELVRESKRRDKSSPEYELIDTGLFDDGRYFDVEIEYAKAGPEDLLMLVRAHNRGPEAAELHVLPHVWFRNTWSWARNVERPLASLVAPNQVLAEHPELGDFEVCFDFEFGRAPMLQPPRVLFCENETNDPHLFGGPAKGEVFKDGIGDAVVAARSHAVRLDRGTKCAAHHRFRVPPGGFASVRLRLRRPSPAPPPFSDFDAVLAARRAEADDFYAELQAEIRGADARLVHRQALAGLMWAKIFYHLDMPQWLGGDETQPLPHRRRMRNAAWQHIHNAEVLSVPDKWEYPWYAAWDLAFHCIPLALVDAEFAKEQLVLLTREWYMHPNGQLPAYEWEFGDANPPVHAWAAFRVFQIDRKQRGDAGDRAFLERVFHKLLLNFTWWVNRKDAEDNNVFQGGFLGLDNIGLFDRSQELPTGGHVNQADGTAWMAMYSLNMLRIALELSLDNAVYQDIAAKFFEHFLHIADAMGRVGEGGLWDEGDAFFYDWLQLPNAKLEHHIPLRVRSVVGLVPLYAVEVIEHSTLERLPYFKARLEWFLQHRPELSRLVHRWEREGVAGRYLLSLLPKDRLQAVLRRLADESEFLSPYGIRSMSRAHEAQPFLFEHAGQQYTVRYTPAESDSHLFGGNSNWRGPIWFPVNYLLIESLQQFDYYFGDSLTVEFPAGSGRHLRLLDVADELSARLTRLFLRDTNGQRPALGDHPLMRHDPHFRDHPLYYEYFHAETGRGAGASHQTGWTALVAKLLQPRSTAAARWVVGRASPRESLQAPFPRNARHPALDTQRATDPRPSVARPPATSAPKGGSIARCYHVTRNTNPDLVLGPPDTT